MQVVHLRHPVGAGQLGAELAGSTPSGAASRNTRPASRTSRAPVQAISAATTSEATASARSQPVATMTRPATKVAAKAQMSVSRWASTPRTLRLERSARPASQVATTLTAAPTAATTATAPPSTGAGSNSRRMPSTVNHDREQRRA